MSKLQATLKCCLLIAAVVCLVQLASLMSALTEETIQRERIVAQLPDQAEKLVAAEAESTRRMLQKELRATTAAALLTTRELAGVVDRRLESIETRADRRLESIENRADEHLKAVDRVAQGATTLLARYGSVPDQLAYANRWLWDCPNYSGCLQSQTLALVGSARATMGAVAKAAPEVAEGARVSSNAFADGFPRIVQNTEDVTENIKRLTTRRWYDRLLGVGAAAASTTLLGVK